MHEALVTSLESALPDEFSKILLDGSIRVLGDADNRMRANLFAAGLRELCTYVLHELAPDDEVWNCAWWLPQKEKRAKEDPELTDEELNRPTRQQRANYATQGGLSDKQIAGYGVDVEHIHKDFLASFGKLNKLTHVRPGTLIEDVAAIEKFSADALTALLDFLRMLDDCRTTIADAVLNSIHKAAVEELTCKSVGELELLSTHTYVDGAWVDAIKVVSIDSRYVHYLVNGEVEVTLNYGSGSDFSNGDGAAMSDSFPFEVTMKAPVTNPERYEDVVCNVDTSSFYQ